VPNGKYSFVAALLNTSYGRAPFYQQFCGGSLIDQDSVLTAAHCVTGRRGIPVLPRPLRITVGRTVLNSDQGQKSWVSRIFIHPRYNGDTVTYDAAVLKLSSSVSGIAPIKLATIRIYAGSSTLALPTHLDSWSRRAELLKTLARATAAGRYSSLGRLTTAAPAASTPRSGSLVSVRGAGLKGIPECTLR
jgi:secreted trypsin-like serine protease